MKAVTIDKLDIKDHLRWAQDQEILDPVYSSEAQAVAQHPGMMGMSVIYSSKFEDLFELQRKNQHWALFSPPQNYHRVSRRLFSWRLFPGLDWEDSDDLDREQNKEENREEAPCKDLIKIVLRATKKGSHSPSLFEKDRAAMLNLLESIQWINKLLMQINARKLQYQKG